MIRKATLAFFAFGAVVANAQFSPGNLVVVRFGDGSAALGATGTPTFLEEFTIAGAPVGTTAMPTAPNGANRQFVNRGSSTSEGALTRSVNGEYLLLAGYDAAVGTGSVATSTSAAINRVIARVSADGTIDTTTALTDSYSGDSVRGACSTDGLDLWTFGTGSIAASAGIRYTTFGSSTATQLGSPPTNIRRGNIYNGQLYISSASGAFQGVSSVGTGLPTTGGQTISLLPGFPTSTGPSNYDFWFEGTSTLYVADDRTLASGGGIQKWVFDGSTWTLVYTMNIGLTSGARNLVVSTSSEDITTIYATTGEAPNRLVKVVDTGALSEFSELAVAGTNTGFRGIAWSPEGDSGVLINGNVLLQDWEGDTAAETISVDIYTVGGGTLLETTAANLDANGDYQFSTTLAAGTYDMIVKGAKWLAKVETLTLTGSGGTVNYSLINGDCDNDNEVTLVDYGIMSASFGLAEGDTGYDDRADLNGDLEVNLFDAGVISANFGQAGDGF